MKLITPPENQGQMVEVSYGWGDGGILYRRVYDQSDRTECWDCLSDEDSADLAETDWEPWNYDAPVGDDQWISCSAPEQY